MDHVALNLRSSFISLPVGGRDLRVFLVALEFTESHHNPAVFGLFVFKARSYVSLVGMKHHSRLVS